MVLEEVSKQPKKHEELPERTNVLFKSKKNIHVRLQNNPFTVFIPISSIQGFRLVPVLRNMNVCLVLTSSYHCSM